MIPIPDLRAWVGAEATDDPTLVILEAAAVARVEAWTLGYFGPSATFTDRVIGDGGIRLALPKYPITAVASVDQSWLTDAVPTPVAVTEFVIRSPYLIRTAGLRWDRGAEFEVEYTAGFAVYPEIYVSAVRDIVAATFQARSVAAGDPGAGVFKSETSPDYSYERFDAEQVDVGPTSDAAAEDAVAAILKRLPRRMRI